MIEGTFRINDTHCGRVNLQMAVRLHDGNRGLYGQRYRFPPMYLWLVVLINCRLQYTTDPFALGLPFAHHKNLSNQRRRHTSFHFVR